MQSNIGVTKTSFHLHSSHAGNTSEPWLILHKEIKDTKLP